MKLIQITEMAAKKICDKCGKTMAANHYWYKGGWRCKGASKATNDAEQTTPVAPIKSTPTPAPTVKPAAPEPKRPKAEKPNNTPSHKREPVSYEPADSKAISQAFPEIKTDQDDPDKVYWSVYKSGEGKMTVSWDHTYKRNTAVGEYKYGARKFESANRRIKQLMDQYPNSILSATILTPERAREYDEWVELNGEPSQVEYERSFGSTVEFLVK